MSGVLVDTHIALWALGEPDRLSDAERALLIDPSVDRRLSPMSIWEAAIERQAGRLRAPRNLTAVLAAEFGCSRSPRRCWRPLPNCHRTMPIRLTAS